MQRIHVTFGLLWVVALAGALGAQGQEPDGPVRGGLFSLPRMQDDVAVLGLAAEDLKKEQYADAVERLQKLLLRGGQGVVPTDSKSRWIGIRLATIQRLRDLPPQGREAYEKLVQREAGALLRIGLSDLGPRQLASLAQDYPTSKVGIDARLRLGDLALEQGEGIEANAHYRAALDALADDDPRHAATVRRASDVRALLGSQLTTRRGTSAYPPRNAQDRLAAERLAPLLAEPPNERIGWPCYGGGAGGLVPMERPTGKPIPRHQWGISARGFDSPLRSPIHVVGGLHGLYVNDGHSLFCLDPLAGGHAALEGPKAR
jgi:hypothetical protein